MMNGNNGNKLAIYGDRDTIREMADRIKRMLPGGAKISDNDALGLAQVGIAHDLDPFNKEVWLIFNEETGKSYGIMVGIQGWRKHARKQSEYWGIGGAGGFHHIVDPEAIKSHGASPNDIVYEYHIADVASIDSWSNSVKRIREATGLTFNEVEKMIGSMPVSIGVGIFSPGERTKMKPHQAAMYRAERDCLRRRFQVRFGLVAGLPDIATEPDEEPDAIIEAIAAEVENKTNKEEQLLFEIGFEPKDKPTNGKPKTEKPWTMPDFPEELPEMSYEKACEFKSKTGIPYVDIDSAELVFHAGSLLKKDWRNDEDAQLKLSAIRTHLTARSIPTA